MDSIKADDFQDLNVSPTRSYRSYGSKSPSPRRASPSPKRGRIIVDEHINRDDIIFEKDNEENEEAENKDYDINDEMNEEKKKVERDDGLSQDTIESEEDDVFDERQLNDKIAMLEEKRDTY